MILKKKIPLFHVILASIALFITIAVALYSGLGQEKNDIVINGIAPKLYRAPREVINTVATESLKQQARDAVVPLYKHDPDVKTRVESRIEGFFDAASVLRAASIPLDNPYVDENTVEPNVTVPEDSAILNFDLTDSQIRYLIDLPTDEYLNLKSHVFATTSNSLELGIKPENLLRSLVSLRDDIDKSDTDEPAKAIAYAVISAALEPNLIVDEEATVKERELKADAVEPVVFLAGQNIVSQGERITPEVYAVLEELGLVKQGSDELLTPIAGRILLAVLSFAGAIAFIVVFSKPLLKNRKEAMILLTLYGLTVVSASLLTSLPMYFVPILAFASLTSILLDSQLAFAATIFTTIVCGVVYGGNTAFYLYFFVTGSFTAFVSRLSTQRSKVFMISVMTAVISAITLYCCSLLFDRVLWSDALLTNLVYVVINGLFTVFLCIGSLPLWEVVFGVITPIKLLDLTQPDSPLINRLVIEAPGTYHHSLIVANLAETAAYDIGANPTLARVGGYYHDIGKLKYPGYFAENQHGDNPHDHLDPRSSAEIIMSHATMGMELASEYGLPPIVKSMVYEHHGNTLIKYFFYKASKEAETPPIETDFRYKSTIPSFRESAVVMLADTVEAAVRAMIPSGKTMDEVEKAVKTLIKDKLDDRQLTNSGLTIKDLDTIAAAFMRVFKGMYHSRIEYPKAITKDLTEPK